MNTSPATAGRVSIRKNIYGNFGCFIGSRKVVDYGSGYNAKLWLAEQLLANATISPASYFSAEDVEKYKILL